MSIWNERIRNKRIEKGLTLSQIADELGVTEATAQRYESGSIKSVPYEVMCNYGKILGCSPAYLMGWDESTPINDKAVLCIADIFSVLNDAGKQKVLDYARDLAECQKYQTSD